MVATSESNSSSYGSSVATDAKVEASIYELVLALSTLHQIRNGLTARQKESAATQKALSALFAEARRLDRELQYSRDQTGRRQVNKS